MSDRYHDLLLILMPMYVQYKTIGRGEDYTAEFTILTAEQFADKVANCPKNELTTGDTTE